MNYLITELKEVRANPLHYIYKATDIPDLISDGIFACYRTKGITARNKFKIIERNFDCVWDLQDRYNPEYDRHVEDVHNFEVMTNKRVLLNNRIKVDGHLLKALIIKTDANKIRIRKENEAVVLFKDSKQVALIMPLRW